MAAVARYDKALGRKELFEKEHDRESLLRESKEEAEDDSDTWHPRTQVSYKCQLNPDTPRSKILFHAAVHVRLRSGEQQKTVEQLIRQYESRLLQDMEQWDLLQEMKAELLRPAFHIGTLHTQGGKLGRPAFLFLYFRDKLLQESADGSR